MANEIRYRSHLDEVHQASTTETIALSAIQLLCGAAFLFTF